MDDYKDRVCCPHCLNAVRIDDTTCTHCGCEIDIAPVHDLRDLRKFVLIGCAFWAVIGLIWWWL